MLHKNIPLLVIEDDQSIRESLNELLVTEGYLVLLAEHGQMAIEILDSLEKSPALILADLSMPIMDGYTFLSRFKREFPKWQATPILIMTAAGTHKLPPEHDPQWILRKPLDVDELMGKVETAYQLIKE